MKQMWLVTVVVVAMMSNGVVHAEPTVQHPGTGNGLLADCTSTDFTNRMVCMAYIIGAADMAGGLGQICRPAQVTFEQTKDVVINRLKSDPGNRHKASSVLIIMYLKATFPCKK